MSNSPWCWTFWGSPTKTTYLWQYFGFDDGDAPYTVFDFALTRTIDNTNIDWRRRFKPVTARRIRLWVKKTWKDVTRIWEIELCEALPKKR